MATCIQRHALAGWASSSLACCVDDPVGRSHKIIISVPLFRPLTLDARLLAGASRDARLLAAAATFAAASCRQLPPGTTLPLPTGTATAAIWYRRPLPPLATASGAAYTHVRTDACSGVLKVSANLLRPDGVRIGQKIYLKHYTAHRAKFDFLIIPDGRRKMATCIQRHALAGWTSSSLACCGDDPVGRSHKIIILVPLFRPLTLDARLLAGASRDARLLAAAATVAAASCRQLPPGTTLPLPTGTATAAIWYRRPLPPLATASGAAWKLHRLRRPVLPASRCCRRRWSGGGLGD